MCTLVLNMDFAQFDCEGFRSTLAADMGIVGSQINFHSARPGSVILSFSTPVFAANAFATRIEEGTSQISSVASFTRATGQTVVPPAFPWQIVVGVVVAVLVLVAVLIIVICVVKRRRNKGSNTDVYNYGGSDYHKVGTGVPATVTASSSAVSGSSYAPPAAASLVSFRLIADVVDVGESVVPARRGDIVFMTAQDAAQGSDWAWVKCGVQEGYVPRNFLQRV